MTARYSSFSLLREGFRGHRGWQSAWAKAAPQPAYDAVIIGGGGHGLATAYYLAKNHGMRRVAVLEKGWIGGGNTGRNTTVVRSNYFYPESVALYDLALRLYEGLSRELNFNVMLSQRGMLIAAHTPAQMEICARIANAMMLNGVDGELMGATDAIARLPLLNQTADARYHCLGGIWQGRAGIARHDAVAWGYARAASTLGVDIIENCEVTNLWIENGAVKGVATTRGEIRTERLAVAAAGATPGLVAGAGVHLPIHTYALQAFVSEPVKPCLDTVLLYLGTGTYVSQSDKGELVFGGGLDRVPTHGQKGNLPAQEKVVAGLLEMFPAFAQLKLLRQWAGVVDVVPDSSPVIGPAPGVEGLYLNCGWGTGGFKAIPAGGWLLAHLLATGQHHEISRPFDLERFISGRLIDEAAGAGISH
ncbi:MAG: sarcosine oxidase subunit beta family protein [Rhodobacteraceae bacterium]|nr:sarcosine oxidase subunit beta family protein [Paracoccaceae bacterium]